MREELDKMQKTDQKMMEGLHRSFIKAREKASKEGEKLKFNIVTFQIHWKSTEGKRVQVEADMMWEGEYKEYAKTAKAGFLTDAEADSNWKAWLADPSHPSDDDGPRGYKRLAVKTGKKLLDFEETSKEKNLTKEEKLGKKTTEEQLAARLKLVYGNAGLDKHEVSGFHEAQGKAFKAMVQGSDGGSSVLSGDGILAPDVASMLHDLSLKRKASRPLCPTEDEEEDEDPDATEKEEGEQAGVGVGSPPSVSKSNQSMSPSPAKPTDTPWFDELKIQRAEREYLASTDDLKKLLVATRDDMMSVIAEFRKKPADAQARCMKHNNTATAGLRPPHRP